MMTAQRYVVWSGWAHHAPFRTIDNKIVFDDMARLTPAELGTGQLLFFCPYDKVDLPLLVRCRTLQGNQVAVLPGEKVQESVARLAPLQPAVPRTSLVIDRLRSGPFIENDTLRCIYDKSLDDAEAVEHYLSTANEILSITSHGRPDAIYPPQAVLCGKSDANHAATKLLCCQHDEGCYYGRRRRIAASSISARIVFLNSCTSGTLGHSYVNLDACLDMRLLQNGVSTVVASPLIHHANAGHAILFYHLLQAGLTVQQSLDRLEAILLNYGLERPNFIVFGNPEYAVEPRCRIDPLTYEAGADGTLHACLHNGSIGWLPWPNSNEYLYCSRNKRVFVDPVPGGLLVYSDGSTVDNHIVIETLPIAALSTTADTMATMQDNFSHLACYGIGTGSLTTKSSQIANLRLSIEHEVKRARSGRGGSVTKIRHKLTEVQHLIRQVDCEITQKLLECSYTQAFHLTETFREAAVLADVTAATCQQCACEAVVYHFRALGSSLVRHVVQCVRCGIVEDYSGKRGRIARVQPIVSPGRQLQMTVGTDGVADGAVCSAVLLDTSRFHEQPICATSEVVAGCATLVLTLPASLPSHHYWVKMYVVECCDILNSGFNIWVKQDEITLS